MGPKPWWARWWWSESTQLDNCPHPSSENFDSLTHLLGQIPFLQGGRLCPTKWVSHSLIRFFSCHPFFLLMLFLLKEELGGINYQCHQLVNVVSECNPHAGECIFFYAFLKHLWDWEKKGCYCRSCTDPYANTFFPFSYMQLCNPSRIQDRIGSELTTMHTILIMQERIWECLNLVFFSCGS